MLAAAAGATIGAVSPGRRRCCALAAFAVLLVALGAVVAHQASALPPGAARSEPIADTGHGERDGDAHFDSLLLRPGHECLVCWLGSLGAGVAPATAASPHLGEVGTGLAQAAECIADLGGSASARGPPLV